MEAQAREQLVAGTMLDDKYRIERLLAIGGMGAVYVGTHVRLRKRVAIKILNPQLSTAPMIERFHREAITASQIGHEGIVQVNDIGTSTEGEPFLVMELLEGESFADRLRSSGRLPVEDACELACSILSALAAAHRAGIVHRDLKPDNVFMVRQSRGEIIKLLDFGISRARGLDSDRRLTTTGLVLGTPHYMSPEQARGDHEITPAADLYALGVILYEMLIGTAPIQADNYNQLMYRVTIGDFVRPCVRRPELPDDLERMILQAMALDPAQRPSADDLEQRLLAYCRPAFRQRPSGRISTPSMVLAGAHHADAAHGVDKPGIGHPMPATPNARSRSRATWIVGSLVALAAVAVVAIMARGEPGHDVEQDATLVAPPTALASPPIPAAPVVTPAASPDMAPSPPTAPQTITLTFAIEPVGAAVDVDGIRITGGKLMVAKDAVKHELRITAPGRIAHEQTLNFDESQRLTVQLKRRPDKAATASDDDDKWSHMTHDGTH